MRLWKPRPHPCGRGARSEPGRTVVGIVFRRRCRFREMTVEVKVRSETAAGEATARGSRRPSGCVHWQTGRGTNLAYFCASDMRQILPGDVGMKIRAGYEDHLRLARRQRPWCCCSACTPRACRTSPPHIASPSIPRSRSESTATSFGNVCHRVVAPPGRLTMAVDFGHHDSGMPDIVAPSAEQVPVEKLPDDVLVYLLGSRYCDTGPPLQHAGRCSGAARAAGRGCSDLRSCPRAAELRLSARLGDPHGLGRLPRAARRVPGFAPSRHHALPLHEHSGPLLHGVPGRHLAFPRRPSPWTSAPGSRSISADAGIRSMRATTHPRIGRILMAPRSRRHRRGTLDQLWCDPARRASTCTPTR